MQQFHPVKRSFAWRHAAVAAAMVLPLAACGGGDTDTSADAGKCDFPPDEIRLIVPFSPGGGYDAWGRLMAPTIAEKLGGDVEVIVENLAGGGGIRGINTVFAGPNDGSQLVVFSPQDLALAQSMGHTEGDFDLTKMTYLGQFTEDPQVFLTSADSDFDSIEDLTERDEPVKHAAQEMSPIELLTYEAYGVDAEYILHEGTPEVSLAIQRGDADVTVGSLSSVVEFLEAGEMKPILYIGSPVSEDMPGYELIKDAPTAESTGQPELAETLIQNRVLAAAADTPKCAADALSQAMAETLEDPEFVEKAEQAALRVVAGDAETAADSAARSLEVMIENQDILKAAMPE
jgi:tripartite-type tricarboxylate transporter receptor subunit TctC